MTATTPDNMSDETVDKLSELIQINKDSVAGFKTAIDAADDPQLTKAFHTILSERANFADELQGYVRRNDGDAEPGKSFKGTAHRWWLKAHAALSPDEAVAVLKDAEAGEDEIKAKYEEVIKDTAGSPVNDVLLKQYAVVKKGHDLIRDLRDAYIKANN